MTPQEDRQRRLAELEGRVKELGLKVTMSNEGFDLVFTEREIKSTVKLYGNYGKGWAHC